MYSHSERRASVRDARNGDEVHRASRIRSPLSIVLCPCLHILVRIRRSCVEYKRRARHRQLHLYLRLRLYWGMRFNRLRLDLWLLLGRSLSLFRRLRRSGRVRDARNGDEVHRASRIRPSLCVVLCPRLHILVRIRRSRVEYKRRVRQRLLLLYLRLRLY